MERCLNFKCEVETVMAPCRKVYKDMQKKATQPKITSFFTKFFVSPSTFHPISFDHPYNFHPGTLMSSQ
jgi:hypothetical protein